MVDLVKITAPGGASAQVNKTYAGNFQNFFSDLSGSGYNINVMGGYNYRNIAGTNTLSNHALGNAVDINPFSGSNVFGGRSGANDLPSNVSDMAANHGLVWGGDWSNPDSMHFEVAKGATPEMFGGASPQTTPDGTPLAGGVGPVTPQQNPDGSVSGSGMVLSQADPPAEGSSGASGGGGTGGASDGGTGATNGSGSGGSAGGSATIPQAIDNQSAQMSKDTEAATKAATSISSSVVSAADKIAAIASATEKSLFSRGVMILVGALFLVGGLYMFGRATGPKMVGKVLHG